LKDEDNPEATALALRFSVFPKKPLTCRLLLYLLVILMRLKSDHYLLSLKTHHIVAVWSVTDD
jgi:microcystin synthetase protein McyE